MRAFLKWLFGKPNNAAARLIVRSNLRPGMLVGGPSISVDDVD